MLFLLERGLNKPNYKLGDLAQHVSAPFPLRKRSQLDFETTGIDPYKVSAPFPLRKRSQLRAFTTLTITDFEIAIARHPLNFSILYCVNTFKIAESLTVTGARVVMGS